MYNLDLEMCGPEFLYQLLDRLRSDCNYYLEHRCDKHLWAGNINDQIHIMRDIYNKLPEKPQWISKEDIDNFEINMLKGN